MIIKKPVPDKKQNISGNLSQDFQNTFLNKKKIGGRREIWAGIRI